MALPVARGRGRLQTFAAFVLGAAIGGVIALLYAPASGMVTRKRIALKVRQLQRSTARRLNQTGRVLACKAGEVREAAATWITNHMPQGNGRHIRRRIVRHAQVH